MVVECIHLLPMTIFIWFLLTFVICYTFAVLQDNVNPLFPYISDTGSYAPGSCIFGQLLNIEAALLALFIYIRYRMVINICEVNGSSNRITKVNYLSSICMGLPASFGLTVVANFQVRSLYVVHVLGAFTAFSLGTIWMCCQTWISLKLYPVFGQRYTNYWRLALTILCLVFSGISFVAWVLSAKSHIDFLCSSAKWNPEDEGYMYHVISTLAELFAALNAMAYVVTFTTEFKQISVKYILLTIEVDQ